MATMSPPKAAVPAWKMKVLPTEDTTVNDPTKFLFLAKYHWATDIAITIYTADEDPDREKNGMAGGEGGRWEGGGGGRGGDGRGG